MRPPIHPADFATRKESQNKEDKAKSRACRLLMRKQNKKKKSRVEEMQSKKICAATIRSNAQLKTQLQAKRLHSRSTISRDAVSWIGNQSKRKIKRQERKRDRQEIWIFTGLRGVSVNQLLRLISNQNRIRIRNPRLGYGRRVGVP